MKRLIVFGLIIMATMVSCQEQLPEQIREQFFKQDEERVSEAGEEMKEALLAQLDEFIHNKDISESLGISETEQLELEQSFENYIDSYELDSEELEHAIDSFKALLKNAEGLTKEELDEKLAKMLEQE